MRSILLGAALALVMAAPARAADCSPLRLENTIRMEPAKRDNRMMVPFTLDGVQKKFLLDTGASLNLVSSAVVQELKLPLYHSRYYTVDLYGNASDDFVEIRKVVLGRAKGEDIQFQVAPNLPFDGVLSAGIFLHDDIDMDFGAKRLNVFSTDHSAGRVVYWPHAALSVVPISMVNGQINLPVTLDGHPMTAILDSGATFTTLDLERAEQKLGFSPDAPAPPGSPPDNSKKKIYPRHFSTLSFKGVTVANPMVIIQPLQFNGGKNNPAILGSRARHVDDEINRTKPDMIIGMDVLHHLHLYLATDEEKLYVTEATVGESVLFKKTKQSAH